MRTLLLTFPLLFSVACYPPPPQAPTTAQAIPAPTELRVWEVPRGVAPKLAKSINSVLTFQDPIVGRASEGPHGTLIVQATPSVLDGIEPLVVAARKNNGKAEAGPSNVSVQYWLVEGSAAAQPKSGPGLGPVQQALDVIVAADGPQSFVLTEARTVHTVDGGDGSVEDESVRIKQYVTVQPSGKILTEVMVRAGGSGEIKTRLALEPGKLAVLGQAGVEDRNLYIIVRPTLK